VGSPQRPAHARLLKEARQRLGITGEVAAERLGVSAAAYRNAENGRYGKVVFENLSRLLPQGEASEILHEFEQFRASSSPSPVDELTGHPRVLLPIELLQGLAEARVTRFHPSRKYYQMLREGRHTISSYVAQATQSLDMVSIYLATGMELENVMDTFEQLLRQKVSVTVSLLDPNLDYLMFAIGGVINARPTTLALRINDTFDRLLVFRQERLSAAMSRLFAVRAHQSLPNASAIIIDGDLDTGLIQLETKGYKMGLDKSFGFEAAAPSEFFTDLRDSYRQLMADGRKINLKGDSDG